MNIADDLWNTAVAIGAAQLAGMGYADEAARVAACAKPERREAVTIIPEVTPEPSRLPPPEPPYEPTQAEIERAATEAMRRIIGRGWRASIPVLHLRSPADWLIEHAKYALFEQVEAAIKACPREEGVLEAARDYLRWANS